MTLDKVAMEYALRFKFKASNNEAEYEALLAGLRLAKHLAVTNNLDTKDSSMATYLAQTQLLLKHFHYQITQIPRAANSHADALARLASAVEDKIGGKIQVELLAAPSTMAAEVCNLQQGDSWITPIYRFLAHGTLPNDKVQAKQIRYKVTCYLIINDQLYKRGFNLPYLRCLTPAEAKTVIREIHEGVYRDHAGSQSLAHKAFHQGYYWPTLHQDDIRISRSCDKCQRYVTISHSPSDAIVTDNGRQFDNNKFRMFCSKFNINLCFASPAHPQSNGQVEAINKIIKRTLKTSLDKAKGCWPEFVPQVLWSYRTSYRTSIGETPFSLAFGIEAVVPVELEQATLRL
ncbi:hypothetical protein ACFX10_028457 [Malus domestica]